MPYNSIPETLEHIEVVKTRLSEIVLNLRRRGDIHDRSKVQEPEVSMFDEWTPKLRACTYGSPEYEEMRKGMGPALEHHYANNPHHPEYWGIPDNQEILNLRGFISWLKLEIDNEMEIAYLENCLKALESRLNNMSLLDIIEMLADWKAATMRHADGDFAKSLEINRQRFGISDQLHHILVNTAKELNWL